MKLPRRRRARRRKLLLDRMRVGSILGRRLGSIMEMMMMMMGRRRRRRTRTRRVFSRVVVGRMAEGLRLHSHSHYS